MAMLTSIHVKYEYVNKDLLMLFGGAREVEACDFRTKGMKSRDLV